MLVPDINQSYGVLRKKSFNGGDQHGTDGASTCSHSLDSVENQSKQESQNDPVLASAQMENCMTINW
eukprot:6268408-Ditylum_brightwellii.AAC.1